MLRSAKVRELQANAVRQGQLITRLRAERDRYRADAERWEASAHRFASDRVTVARGDAAEMARLRQERDDARDLCHKQERILADLQAANEAGYRELAEQAAKFAADGHVEAE